MLTGPAIGLKAAECFGAASCYGSFKGCLHNLRKGAMSSRISSPTPIAVQSTLKHQESAFLLLQCFCQGEVVLQQ